MRISDWSSDVCSSDLLGGGARRNGIALSVSAHSELAGARIPSDKLAARNAHLTAVHRPNGIALQMAMVAADEADMARSEERRVGKECVSKCRSRWSPDC